MRPFSIEWHAPEFSYREKDVSWYWISATIAIILLSVSVWQKNFLFAVFIVIAEILILVWAGQKPRTIEFKLDEIGLTIDGKKFYPYSSIAAFSIDENASGEWRELAFRFGHGMRPFLKVFVPSERSEEIEKTLITVIQKTDFEDSFLDILQRLIGF